MPTDAAHAGVVPGELDRKGSIMEVLVTYASRHGSTTGIAERVAETLRARGLSADARPVDEVRDVGAYDAVVVGAAVYMYHWLKDAVRFVQHHRDELAGRPVWLFSSGPLGTDQVDEHGVDVRVASRPKELDELASLVRARGTEVFFGAWDPEAPPVGLVERMMRHTPASEALPPGDFRDWEAIEAWAATIAEELTAPGSTAVTEG